MFRAISQALAFFFLLLVLKIFAPEVFVMVIQIITDMLTILSQAIHAVASNQSTQVPF